ncbi:flagellar export protein FliJ [Gluconacetobacter sp. Hr-1-5]|uniref:flagellar export protein FliJ n=1 Tax=Gluconacetobacter sp. Hr-1-5 TaxID=3395370 RepID=UPI003B5202A0
MNARTRALRSLIRLHKTKVDQAKATMAEALASEHTARARLESCRATIESERQAAMSEHVSMDDFRRWLPFGQQAVERAENALHIASQASDQARATLMQANAALKAATSILDRRMEEEKEIRTRREMAEIDDLSRRERMMPG